MAAVALIDGSVAEERALARSGPNFRRHAGQRCTDSASQALVDGALVVVAGLVDGGSAASGKHLRHRAAACLAAVVIAGLVDGRQRVGVERLVDRGIAGPLSPRHERTRVAQPHSEPCLHHSSPRCQAISLESHNRTPTPDVRTCSSGGCGTSAPNSASVHAPSEGSETTPANRTNPRESACFIWQVRGTGNVSDCIQLAGMIYDLRGETLIFLTDLAQVAPRSAAGP